MQYNEIREKYNEFIFHGYEIIEDSNFISIEYSFETVGLSTFRPKWRFEKKFDYKYKKDGIFDKLVFTLGMAELVSYWKITCSKNVKIKAGYLTQNEINWWKKLYFNGLGEFFFINNISTDIIDFMNISCAECENNITEIVSDSLDELSNKLSGMLIPIGGGKDSIVTLELLKETANENFCYMINQKSSSIEAAKIAGYNDAQIISASRSLDKNMLALNQNGFLNGHTPFSSIVAFSAILQAFLLKKKYVVLSNESSANEPTVKIGNINHQYSKSYEFELDFSNYIHAYTRCNVEYFSFLRPISELQIADIFSGFSQYHKIFKSCNRGSKTDSWCCNCAKCLFVYIILSPFLSQEELTKIFGENLLNKQSLLDIFEEIIGIRENKPFECVGSTNEACAALDMLITKMENASQNMPLLLSYYRKSNKYKTALKYNKNEYDCTNLLPAEFEKILKNIMTK